MVSETDLKALNDLRERTMEAENKGDAAFFSDACAEDVSDDEQQEELGPHDPLEPVFTGLTCGLGHGGLLPWIPRPTVLPRQTSGNTTRRPRVGNRWVRNPRPSAARWAAASERSR